MIWVLCMFTQSSLMFSDLLHCDFGGLPTLDVMEKMIEVAVMVFFMADHTSK